MKSNRAVLTAVVVLVIIVAGWWIFRRGSSEKVDLISQFGRAKQEPGGQFSVAEAALNGESKQAIAAPANGRLTFHVKVPEDGWLRVSLGMKPESWTTEGNGVYFSAGISDGRAHYEPLFTQTLNPFKNPSERHWIPVSVDLSAYAGEEMDLIFNTRSSGPNIPDDQRGDLPLWGGPTISR
jgi:hypothetical protein